ncbi:PP2C family protein-serine/threonine phosphatase [Nocardia vaccinii]|uniref:PP2C family protein-serine/threonine phosphatase n=1 Tax=Nocardia vaccinii TaxID=1822 RepID=UPI000832D61E|nr:protein phosphatase 2C domain-containing protein [Nocardia vaccinii]
MRIRVEALTHRGLRRVVNEDCVGWGGWAFTGPTPAPLTVEFDITQPTTIVVCDGLGGHAGGREASRLACETLTEPGLFGSATATGEIVAMLGGQLRRASEIIDDAGAADPRLARMGCTVVGVVIVPDGRAVVFNVGDSHCYRVEGRYLAQLTVDHRRPGSNVLRQALGGGARMAPEPDYFDCPIPPAPGLLLCTDGLSDYADTTDLERLAVTAGPEFLSAARDLAFAGGGGDNVTMVRLEAIGDTAV